MDIHGNEFLRGLDLDGDHRVEEINKLFALVLGTEEEINTILGLLDIQGVPVGIVLEDELLQEEERALVKDLLADLDTSLPVRRGERLLTLPALLGVDDEDDLETLLEEHAVLDRVLDGELDLYPPRVGFRPDETGVDDSHFVETPEPLETQGEQLSGFGQGRDPTGGGQQPSITVPAEV